MVWKGDDVLHDPQHEQSLTEVATLVVAWKSSRWRDRRAGRQREHFHNVDTVHVATEHGSNKHQVCLNEARLDVRTTIQAH